MLKIPAKKRRIGRILANPVFAGVRTMNFQRKGVLPAAPLNRVDMYSVVHFAFSIPLDHFCLWREGARYLIFIALTDLVE